jgi:hypothetical protein
MDFSQMRLQQQDNARKMLYQNSGYQFERRDKKTLILDIEDASGSAPLNTAGKFKVDLFEPLIVDKLSDIYLDNFSTFNSLLCGTNDRSCFSLQIDEFNINSNCASTNSNQHLFNRILIPNENNNITDIHSSVIHKGKKMNYICSVNPGKISSINGKITDLAGNSIFSISGKESKLYSITTDPISKDILPGTSFTMTVSGSSRSFKIAVYSEKGSTKIYFNSDDGNVTGDLGTVSSTISSTDTGLDGLTPVDASKRSGDYSRFIAEFVIVARD